MHSFFLLSSSYEAVYKAVRSTHLLRITFAFNQKIESKALGKHVRSTEVTSL